MSEIELSLAVQAGGESNRMGQDKGLLPFMGQPLVKRVLDRLAPLAQEVLVTTNRPGDYAFLGVPLFADRYRGRGSLAGLHTALSAARGRLVAVVACDMPFASPELLAAQRSLLAAENWDAAVPVWEGRLQPFHAIYCREACLPWVQVALETGQPRASAWLGNVRLRRMEPEEVTRYDPTQLACFNVNTPEDFQRAEALARKQAG